MFSRAVVPVSRSLLKPQCSTGSVRLYDTWRSVDNQPYRWRRFMRNFIFFTTVGVAAFFYKGYIDRKRMQESKQ